MKDYFFKIYGKIEAESESEATDKLYNLLDNHCEFSFEDIEEDSYNSQNNI